jgi:hypothetical protein
LSSASRLDIGGATGDKKQEEISFGLSAGQVEKKYGAKFKFRIRAFRGRNEKDPANVNKHRY